MKKMASGARTFANMSLSDNLDCPLTVAIIIGFQYKCELPSKTEKHSDLAGNTYNDIKYAFGSCPNVQGNLQGNLHGSLQELSLSFLESKYS